VVLIESMQTWDSRHGFEGNLLTVSLQPQLDEPGCCLLSMELSSRLGLKSLGHRIAPLPPCF
jgi:hypothetical protein